MIRAEITRGWDGREVLASSNHATQDDARKWVRDTAPKHSRWYQDVWTVTRGNHSVVVDFGSHQIFARITFSSEETTA